jgi:hypothetical protein
LSALVAVAANAWDPLAETTRAQLLPQCGDQRSSIQPTVLPLATIGAVRIERAWNVEEHPVA